MNTTTQIVETVVDYLNLIGSPVWTNSGWFTEEDQAEVQEKGFLLEMASFHDGKILRCTKNDIDFWGIKGQGVHFITPLYLKLDNVDISFEIHATDDYRLYGIDPVFESLNRDDYSHENWVILENSKYEESFKDLTEIFIPKELFLLFGKLKHALAESSKGRYVLRMRLKGDL